MTTWTIAIDWERNGNFDSAYDDVTNRVQQTNWFLGMRKIYQEIADNSVCVFTLNNADQRFSPDNLDSPLAGKVMPLRPVRIQSNDGTTTRTHWVGWIEAIKPTVNKFGERTVQILASGALPFYKAAETALILQENKRTDQIVAELIKEVVIPPALNGAWFLDRVGNSELDTSTMLADSDGYSELENGVLTLRMAADNWVREGGFSDVPKTNFDVYHAISDITAAERGKFFFSREGKAVFWNRHHLLLGGTTVADFDDSMTDMAYNFAGLDECKNEVIVMCHPRSIGTVNTDVLWELGESVIRVEANKPRVNSIKYTDETNKRIGAKDVNVTGLTFESGTAIVTVAEQANGAELTFTSVAGAVVTGCVIRGRKIVDSGVIEAKASDTTSIIDYGRRTLRLNLPSIDNVDGAQDIADFERNRRSYPRGMVQALTVASHGRKGGNHHAEQLALTLGDKINITETQTAHSAAYYVMGEAHELTNGANLWKTTWYLEPAPTVYPWKLGAVGRSELGNVTWLAY